MKSFGEIIKSFRQEKELPLRAVAKEIGIDTSMLGKLEKNERRPSKDLIKKLSKYYNTDEQDLLIALMSDNVANELIGNENAMKILKIAQEKIKNNTKK